ncbi:MAG: bacteriorhodopsin [Halobacteriaceae archaeon]
MTLESLLLQIDKAEPFARSESIWLAIGTVLMLLGTLYFIARGWGVDDPEAQEYYIITILIPGIATASYLSMLFGFGLTEITLTNPINGRTVLDIYWARYADWLFTTPLLLLDLGLLAGADSRTIGALIGLDGFMIVTGLVGALTTVPTFRYVWWLVSTIALLFILYYLYGILSDKAADFGGERASTFKTLRNLVLVLWSVYPVLWLVGTEGAGIVPLYVETLGFMILDVLAKVGFGFILLRSRAIFGEGAGAEAAGSAAAGD